jgi:hypothetical protein
MSPAQLSPQRRRHPRRHQVTVTAAFEERCSDAWQESPKRALPRGPDGMWGFQLPLDAPGGHLCLVAEMVPGPGGVLTRRSPVVDVRLIPPIHLKSAPVAFGAIKQEQTGLENVDLVFTFNHFFDNAPPSLPGALVSAALDAGRVFDRTVAEKSHSVVALSLKLKW